MLSHSKKSFIRNTKVGQSVNNSSIRKVGGVVKNPLFIKNSLKILI